MTTSVVAAGTSHHGLAAHEVVLLLETDAHRGLDTREAGERLARYGPNTLPAVKGAGLLVRILSQFHNPLIYVLIAAGVITAALGEYIDSAVIFGVVVINAVIGFIQESKAEAALEGLRSMVRTQATVIRDGHRRTIASEELVPGDLVVLEAGDKVPADLRLTQLAELRINESALTGESVPVTKDEVVLAEAIPVADRHNMAYSGTLVTTGSGTGIVIATGAETELGQTFTAAVALAVGAIPEGLPAAVTITLAIGVARMARRRAVIRRLPAVETLGSTTVICSDKTGTLTENQMTVRTVWTPDSSYDVTGSGYAPDGALQDPAGAETSVESDQALRWSLLAGAACSDAALIHEDGHWDIVGDPTEGAMLVVAGKAGLGSDQVKTLPRLATIPFSSERQYMATLHHDTTSGASAGDVALAKGGVERMLELCDAQMHADGTVGALDRAAALRAAGELAVASLVVAVDKRLRRPA